jgi:hypothetical protein
VSAAANRFVLSPTSQIHFRETNEQSISAPIGKEEGVNIRSNQAARQFQLVSAPQVHAFFLS